MKNCVEECIKNFVLGGKAEFEIYQDEGNKSARYSLKAGSTNYFESKNSTYFVYCTPMNKVRNSTVYCGWIRHMEGKWKFSSNLKEGVYIGGSSPEEYLKSVSALLWIMNRDFVISDGIHIIHRCKCGVCGRPLTGEKSQKMGIGLSCLKRVGLMK